MSNSLHLPSSSLDNTRKTVVLEQRVTGTGAVQNQPPLIQPPLVQVQVTQVQQQPQMQVLQSQQIHVQPQVLLPQVVQSQVQQYQVQSQVQQLQPQVHQVQPQIQVNVSSVVEFKWWWVLESKIFGQKSIYSKETIVF